ncbi:MAG TPA: MarR family winged helix-turn-helix transcriptional regulator [Planctomycetota bacterium]|nr:MarR family winged helix-turn-helix transcriptional regulator [Planctomycetota bacterium]
MREDERANVESGAPPAAPKRETWERIVDSMIRVFYGARQHSQGLKAKYGITAAQLQLLKLLEKQGDLTHSEISERMYLRGSTVSGIIDRLEKRSLVRRKRSRVDRRLVRVGLSDAGKKLLASVPRGQSKFGALRHFVAELPKSEAESFARTLEKIAEFMGAGTDSLGEEPSACELDQTDAEDL